MPTFINGALISVGGRFIGRGLYILTQIFLARALGPDGFGLYALGWTAIRMIGSISMLGLDFGVIRFGSTNYRETFSMFRAVLRQSIGLATISGGISAALLFLSTPYLAKWFQDQALIPILYLSAFGLLFYILSRIITSSTLVTQQMVYSVGLNEFIQPLSNIGFILLFTWLGWGESGALLALVLSFVVMLFAGIFLLNHLIPNFFHPTEIESWLIKPLLAFSIPVAFTNLFSLNLLWIDRLIVGIYGTTADLGIYQAVSQSSLLFATILASMNVIFIPMITDLLALKSSQRLEELFRVSTKWGLYISLPLASILILKPQAFLLFTFGPEYGGAFQTLRILTIAQLINVASGAVNLLLIMGGYQVFWMAISALMLLINIIVGIIWVPRLGIEGAAWGTAVAMFGLGVSGLFYAKLKLDMWPYDRRYLKGILAIFLASAGGLLINQWEPSSILLELSITSAVVVLLYFAALWLLGFDNEDWLFIDILKTGILKKIFHRKPSPKNNHA